MRALLDTPRRRRRRAAGAAAVATGCAALVALFGVAAPGASPAAPEPLRPAPLGLPPVPIPPENPLTPEKIALGERLFYETGFSIDGQVSCATCHLPERYFTDPQRFSKGILGVTGSRNAATVLNAAYYPSLLSEGRAESLEEQIKYPISNPLELNTTPERVVEVLASDPGYRPYFRAAFGDEAVTWERVTAALASFERTLLAGNSAFDRFQSGDEAALSPSARRGWELFRGKAGCVGCHAYTSEQPFFTDHSFHNTGVAWGNPKPDSDIRFTPELGRYWETRDRRDLGAFRTPSLRNVAMTAPYMRNGHFATLAEVVEHYAAGPPENPFLDDRLEPLDLSAQEKADLVAFLEALTGEVDYRRPEPAASRRLRYGRLEVLAGNTDYGNGGPAVDAVFINVGGMVTDPGGNLYVVDAGANQVRRIDAESGRITAVAGTGFTVGDPDAEVATERPLRGPVPLAIDGDGRHLYIGEILSRKVLRVDLASGAITELGAPAGGFGSPAGLLWTPAGLLVADSPRGQVWRQGPGGEWSGLLQEGMLGGNIRTLARDSHGRVYIGEYFAHRVLRWDPASGQLGVVAGTGQSGRGADGETATRAAIRTPDGLAVDPRGGLLIADKGNHRICRVDLATGVLETVAESAAAEGDGERWTPGPIAVDAGGDLWIGDLESNRILRLARGADEPVVVAGAGSIGDGGPATDAFLAHPGSIIADARGNVYISDTLHHRVRRIDAESGRIRTVAGTGMHGYNGDGIPATEAMLSYPAELVMDGEGRLYFGDYYNNRVRTVDPKSGLIATLAGNGDAGQEGDGGPATAASMLNPHALLLEGGSSLLVASALSPKVRRIDLRTGAISAVAMKPGEEAERAFYGMAHWRGGLVMARPRPGLIEVLADGELTTLFDRSQIFFPQDVAVSPDGELFIAETGRNRVLRWTGEELEVVIENLGRPGSVSFDANGAMLISDTFHNRVLRLSPLAADPAEDASGPLSAVP